MKNKEITISIIILPLPFTFLSNIVWESRMSEHFRCEYFSCRESTPIEVSATSTVKEEISYQWIIFDAKMLHTERTIVHGPIIRSKLFPFPIEPYLDFTEDIVKFALCVTRKYGSDRWLVLHEETIRKNSKSRYFCTLTYFCNCIITILSMETKEPIFSFTAPEKRYLDTHFDPIKLMDYDDFSTYLNDEPLTIQVLVTLTDKIYSSQHTDISIVGNIINNYNRMTWSFDDARFTDCIIRVQDKILKVHKVILASASEVFRKMLADSSDNAIELSDVDFEDVSDIVAYIYTGTATGVRSRTSKILVAADCFGLRNLVGECVYELQCRFTIANIANSLCLAGNLTSYGHHLLKTACIEFIKPNIMSVYQSDSWKALKETHHALALEIAMEVLK